MKLSMFIYGASGIGKTHLLGTAEPPMTPLLIIDSDPGLVTLEKTLFHHYSSVREFEEPLPDDAVTGITIASWGSLQPIYSWLAEHPDVYQTVAWDSLTGLIEINRADIVAEMTRTDPDHDPDIPELRDYLRSQLQAARALRAFLSLPSNLILTGHSSAAENPVAGEEIVPDLAAGLLRTLKLKIDVIAFYRITDGGKDDEEVRRLYFESRSGRFLARSRVQSFRGSLDNPTLSRIYQLYVTQQEVTNVSTNSS